MLLLTSRAAAQYFRNCTEPSETEELWIAALNPQCALIKGGLLFKGTVDGCFIHPRDVFRFALIANASSIVVGHNHPSGHCQPSRADELFTKRLKQAAEMLQIPLLDHIIVTKSEYFSFAESRWSKSVMFDSRRREQ